MTFPNISITIEIDDGEGQPDRRKVLAVCIPKDGFKITSQRSGDISYNHTRDGRALEGWPEIQRLFADQLREWADLIERSEMPEIAHLNP